MKPHLSGAVQTCVPMLGWWYFALRNLGNGVSGIFGPFPTRTAARDDRRARLAAGESYPRYQVPYAPPVLARAEVKVVNGDPVWSRVDL